MDEWAVVGERPGPVALARAARRVPDRVVWDRRLWPTELLEQFACTFLRPRAAADESAFALYERALQALDLYTGPVAGGPGLEALHAEYQTWAADYAEWCSGDPTFGGYEAAKSAEFLAAIEARFAEVEAAQPRAPAEEAKG